MVEQRSDLERIRDYASGRLSEEERRMFEERLAREPVLVRELEQSVAFKEGLQQLRAQGYFDPQAPRPDRSRLRLPALIAASLAAVALFIGLHPHGSPAGLLRAGLESPAGAADTPAALFTFVSLRGLSAPARNLPGSGQVEFRILPSVRAAGYTVTLARQDGPPRDLGTLRGLPLGADGYVHFYADAAALSAGRHVLRISAEGAAAATAEFAFSLSEARAP